MYKQALEKDLKRAVKELGFIPRDMVLSISENSKFGDYSSNIALQLSKQAEGKDYQSPRDIANKILEKLGHPTYLERVEVAGAGFINFFLKDEFLIKSLDDLPLKKVPKKKVLVEYASPNANKPFHIGHLRNLVTGESISRLLDFTGNEIFRATYTADIGLSTAKVIWQVKKEFKTFVELESSSLKEKAVFLGQAYVKGSEAFDEDETVKAEIAELNRLIYQKDPESIVIWQKVRDWSAGYLATIYNRFGTEFDAELWESEVGDEGKRIVEANMDSIFMRDQGAIIFPGEKYGLHNRVFVNSDGNPTYEAKELGVTQREQEIFPYDEAIHIVANEQSAYFEVVIKAIEVVDKRMLGKKKHLPYAMVNLSSGKMSSRKGNIIAADDLVDQVKQVILAGFKETEGLASKERIAEKMAIAAIKFYMLKFGLNTDIAYDVEKSVALQGDTGIYVLYTYVRTVSLLAKAQSSPKTKTKTLPNLELEEREILRLLEYFDMVVEHAAAEYAPNYLAEYLLNLSRVFNLLYEKYPIVGSTSQDFRLKLTAKVGETLKLGLYLMGIETVERM